MNVHATQDRAKIDPKVADEYFARLRATAEAAKRSGYRSAPVSLDPHS